MFNFSVYERRLKKKAPTLVMPGLDADAHFAMPRLFQSPYWLLTNSVARSTR